MPMTVQDLEGLIASLPGTFTLADDALGIDAAKDLFDQCLPQSKLVLESASSGTRGLVVDGQITLPNVGSGAALPASVTFSEDTTKTSVTGLEILVTLDTWKVATPYLTIDVTFLHDLNARSV